MATSNFNEETGEHMGTTLYFHPYDGGRIGRSQMALIEAIYHEDGLHRDNEAVRDCAHAVGLVRRGILEYDGEWLVLTREGRESIREIKSYG